MAKTRDSKTGDGRHLLTVGLPVGTILGVLVLGAALQSGPSEAGSGLEIVGAEPPLPPPPAYDRRLPDTEAAGAIESSTPGANPQPDVDSSAEDLSRLADRALNDAARLERTGRDWTSQVGVYCDAERVGRLVERFDETSPLYVLPVIHDGRACFRICWGSYATADRARHTGSDLPPPLRAGSAFPRHVSTVLQ